MRTKDFFFRSSQSILPFVFIFIAVNYIIHSKKSLFISKNSSQTLSYDNVYHNFTYLNHLGVLEDFASINRPGELLLQRKHHKHTIYMASYFFSQGSYWREVHRASHLHTKFQTQGSILFCGIQNDPIKKKGSVKRTEINVGKIRF